MVSSSRRRNKAIPSILTFVVTKYETYASFVPSFSLIGCVTVHSRTPSPTPARSKASACRPRGPALPRLLPFVFPEPSSSPSPPGLVTVDVLPWPAGSFCQETLAKSSFSILISVCAGQSGYWAQVDLNENNCWSGMCRGCFRIQSMIACISCYERAL